MSRIAGIGMVSDIAAANLRPSLRSRWRASAVAAAIAATGIGLVSRRFQMLGRDAGCTPAGTGRGRAGGRCVGRHRLLTRHRVRPRHRPPTRHRLAWAWAGSPDRLAGHRVRPRHRPPTRHRLARHRLGPASGAAQAPAADPAPAGQASAGRGWADRAWAGSQARGADLAWDAAVPARRGIGCWPGSCGPTAAAPVRESVRQRRLADPAWHRREDTA